MSEHEGIVDRVIQRLQKRAEREGVSVDILVERLLEQDSQQNTQPMTVRDIDYQTFVDYLPSMVFGHLPDGEVIYANYAMADSIRLTPAEVVGLNVFDVIPQEIAKRIRKRLASLTLQNPIASGEHEIDFPPGTRRWERWTDRAFFDGEGQVLFYLSVGQDVTERKRAIDALEESQEQLSTLMDTLPGMAFRCSNTKNWTMEFVSSGCEDLTGYAPEALLNDAKIAYADLIHPDDRQRIWEVVQDTLTRGNHYELEYRIITAQGSEKTVWERGVAVQRAGSRMLEGFISDITERKQAEARLRESEALYESLVEELPMRIYRIDREGRLTFANSTLLESVGLSAEDVIGEMSYDFYDEELAEKYRADDTRVLEHGETVRATEVNVNPTSGEKLFVDVIKTPVYDREGNIQGVQGAFWDVTERTRLEQTLRESEALYESLVETLPMNIYRIDREGRLTFVNSSLLANLGTTLDNILGKTAYDFYPDDIAKKYRTDDAHVLETGETFRCTELNISPSTGERQYVEVLKVPIYDDAGNITGIQGVFWDVTEHKNLEQHLRESEARYRSIVEDLPVLLCSWLPGGKITFVNQAYAKAFGKLPDDLIGTNILDLVPEDKRETVKGMMQALSPENSSQTTEHEVVDAKGNIRWQRWIDRALFHPDGSVISYHSFGQDITERKQAELALEQKHAELDRFFSIAPGLLAISNFEGKFVHLNDAWEQILGHSLDELYARRFLDFVHPDDIQATIDAMHQLRAEKRVSGFVNRYRTRSGAYRYIEWTAQTDGTLIYNAALDITERIQGEEMARQMERLKSRVQKEHEHNALIQRVISALSHDLRTPLAVVLTSRDLLYMHYEKLSDDRRLELLDRIRRQIEFANKLLEDTVQMVRGALSEEPFKPVPTNLELLCQVNIEEVATAYKRERSPIFVNRSSLQTVAVDEVLVSRILLNLLSNAVKYSPPDSEIRLELDQDEAWILLRVIDQGIGIPEDELGRIFEPFFRSDDVHSIEGTGLGLSIVKDCVERHKGKISVQSKFNQGSTFIVQLPLLN